MSECEETTKQMLTCNGQSLPQEGVFLFTDISLVLIMTSPLIFFKS